MIPAPMPLGPFVVFDNGLLKPRSPDGGPIRFHFTWRRRGYTVHLTGNEMTCTAGAGRVPSSLAGQDRRNAALAVLRSLPPALPEHCRLRLLPDHRVEIVTMCQAPWPATVTELLTPLVDVLRHTAPVLDLFDEEGVGPRVC